MRYITSAVRRCKFILIGFLIFTFSSCQKQSENWWSSVPSFEPKPAKLLKGPYLQNVKTDAITIKWESQRPNIGKVLFGKNAVEENEVAETDSAAIHEVTLTGLEIETVYKYQVVSGDLKSEIHTFETAIREDSPFSFAVYGDNKEGPFNYQKIAKLILNKRPNFVIHNGDFVNRGGIYKQWQKLFFNPASKMLSEITLFGAIGNHEDNSENYYNFFTFPGNEKWYSFDFGNTHFLFLDTNEDVLTENSEQMKWLLKELQNNQATWTIVNSHHPPFTAGGNYYRNSRIELKNLLHPIFEKYGVDVVFSGHDHNYERSKPIMSKAGAKPVTYVVCGNGGTPMRYIGWREWTQHAERVFGFVKINIEGQKLHLKSFNINDEIIDEFTLDKSDPQSVQAYKENIVYLEDIDDRVQATKYYTQGRKLRKARKYEEAFPLLKKAFAADSTCIEALAGMAKCYFEFGKVDSAIVFAEQAIQKKPNYPFSYEVLVDIYHSKGDYEQAIAWCKKWLTYEKDSSDANSEIADIYKKQKKYDLAIAEMKKAILINPADSDLYKDLGELYEKVNDRENALIAYQKALDWYLDEDEDEDILEIKAKIEAWNDPGKFPGTN
ncbi:MAG: metallophosphoesterase [bacterium]